MRRALPVALAVVLVAGMAGAQARVKRSRGDVHRGKQRLRVTDRAAPAATSTSTLVASLFPTGPAASDECTGNSLTFSDGTAITSTRSSSGTCFKSDATLVTLTTDKPRVQSVGLLRESAATNSLLRSDQIQTSPWNSAGTTTGNATTAPDGTLTATRIVYSSLNASNYQLLSGLTSSLTFAHSVFIKQGPGGSGLASVGTDNLSGTATCTCYASDGRACTVFNSGSSYCGASITTDSTWVRLVVISTGSIAHTQISTFVRPGTIGNINSGDAYFWGVQTETGARASSYIATAGTTVTRSADSLSFTAPALLVDSEGCINATVFNRSVVTPAVWLGMTGYAYQDTSTVAKFFDGTNTTSATAGSTVEGRAVVTTVGWRSSDNSVSVSNDGVIAAGTYDGAWTSGTVYLGGKSDGTGPLNGSINKLFLYTSKASCP